MKRVKVVNGKATIKTKGKILAIPTGNDLLPLFNEKTLNPNRLTIAESPFGGLKGSYPPDYGVGTVSINTGDGIYLTDVNGNNTSKVLTAGKLKEVGSLTVDITSHSITEEFIIKNTNLSNSPSEITYCEDLTGIGGTRVTYSLDSTNYTQGSKSVLFTVTDSTSAWGVVGKGSPWNWADKHFLCLDLKGTSGKSARIDLYSDGPHIQFTLPVFTGNWQKVVLPLLKPTSSGGGTFNYARVTQFNITFISPAVNDTLNIDNIFVDVAKSAYVELQINDFLADSSAQIYSYNGTAYQLCGTYKLDSGYSAVSITASNWTTAESTKLDDVYGSGNGRAIFPKSVSGEMVTGSTGTLTYSGNKGCSRRIGLKINLPPSDSGRTNFNKIRLKFIIYYNNNGVTTYEFENSNNASYGLQNMIKPWIVVYDPATNLLDFYLGNYKPKNLSFTRDETGTITELELSPGNGILYHGKIIHNDLLADADADLIPDCLDYKRIGSLYKFLQSYDFCEDWFTDIDISASSIVTNDFGITADSLDIVPYAISEGDSVSNTSNAVLPVAETVATATGNVSVMDVRGKTAVRVRDTAFTNGGDCKVWDTVTTGNTTESTWIRVFSTDWVFTGDCVLENGIIRHKILASGMNSTLYLYQNSTWVAKPLKHIGVGGTGVTTSSISVQTVSPDLIILSIIETSTGGSFTIAETLQRGKSYTEIDTGDRYFAEGAFGYLMYSSNGDLNDADLSDGINNRSTLWTCSISRIGAGVIPFAVVSKGISWIHMAYGFGKTDGLKNKIVTGILPFDCTKLFKDVTSLEKTAGVTSIVDAAASTGNALRIISASDWVKFNGTSNSVPPGTYRVFVRIRGNATFTGGAVNVVDYSTSTYLQKPTGGDAKLIPNLTSSYAYYSVDFVVNTGQKASVSVFGYGSYEVYADYVLIVPISLIEKYAKRALWQLTPGTKTLKSVPR
jgi:hypothetical protein